MEPFNNILRRIELAINLGDEPTQEELAMQNMDNIEYLELLTLNSMIENDIELNRKNNNIEVTPLDLLRQNYNNVYYPLLEKFGLTERLPRITN